MARVLHVVSSMARAGAETMIMNLYRSIDREKFQFDFYSTSGRVGEYDDEIRDLGGNIYYAPSGNKVKKLLSFFKFIKANKQYSIVHVHILLGSALYLMFSKFGGIKLTICHSHSSNYRDIKNKILRSIYYKFCTNLIKIYADVHVACGQKAGVFLYPNIAKFIILPNSISLDTFVEIGQNNTDYLRKEFPHQDEVFKIVQIGRLIDVKNHIFSLKLAKILSDRNIQFDLFIVGQGPLEEKIKTLIDEYGLQNKVKLLGVRNDIPYIMAGADLNIMPSLYEGFPVVLVEAQAVGLKSLVSANVSREVDLGLALVEFEDIGMEQNWIDKIISLLKERRNPNFSLIFDKLSSQGFDINQNVVLLEKVYGSL